MLKVLQTGVLLCVKSCSFLLYFVHQINNSPHLARKYARIFVRGHYLFREANRFPRAKLEENCELRRTDSVFMDKYPGTFSHQMEAIVFFILQFVLQHAGFENWGITLIFPSFSWGIFSHVTHLDQSRVNENI